MGFTYFYTRMKQGVFLVAFGKKGYVQFAYNLADSIKFFNPNIHITLYHDESIEFLPDHERAIFDNLIPIPTEVKYHNHKIDPPFIKTSVYDVLPYEENLYLDVDALCFKDIQPLLDELSQLKEDFYCPTYGVYHKSQGDHAPFIEWAQPLDIYRHFHLNDETSFPAPQSSFQWIRKSEVTKQLYKKVQENLASPIPLSRLVNQWGGTQPDELYLGGALAQMNIVPEQGKEYMFFGHVRDQVRTLTQIRDAVYFLSVYGGYMFTRQEYTEWYDRVLKKEICRGRREHQYKYGTIAKHKHANNKPVSNFQQAADNNTVLLKGEIEIKDTALFNSNDFLQEYSDQIGRKVRVTNWLNCTFIHYNNKRIFVYRMECRPFCEKMRLAICQLDENDKVIPGTNKLLNLYTALRLNGKTYKDGVHSEDPRFFVHNNELYLSYTDGYQMAQAKINPDSLDVIESYYIEKPVVGRVEKNWTFFSQDEKLYCLYDIPSQSIFEMHGNRFTKLCSSEWENPWKYGEIRGGTSPMLIGDKYLAFFHSAISVTHKGYAGRQYFMGAYTFENKYPFKPIAITSKPILAGEDMSEHIPRLSNRIFVVFPGGVEKLEESYRVYFGYNDYQCRSVEVSQKMLDELMVPVEYKEGVLA